MLVVAQPTAVVSQPLMARLYRALVMEVTALSVRTLFLPVHGSVLRSGTEFFTLISRDWQ